MALKSGYRTKVTYIIWADMQRLFFGQKGAAEDYFRNEIFPEIDKLAQLDFPTAIFIEETISFSEVPIVIEDSEHHQKILISRLSIDRQFIFVRKEDSELWSILKYPMDFTPDQLSKLLAQSPHFNMIPHN